MKRFHFKLERLLELRAFHERRAELLLAERAGRCAVLSSRIEENLSSRAHAAREMFAPGRHVEDYRATELYLYRMDRERERLNAELALAEVEREKSRVDYVEKRKSREAIDKLKERRREDYYRIAEREEVKALDDLARRKPAELGR